MFSVKVITNKVMKKYLQKIKILLVRACFVHARSYRCFVCMAHLAFQHWHFKTLNWLSPKRLNLFLLKKIDAKKSVTTILLCSYATRIIEFIVLLEFTGSLRSWRFCWGLSARE